MKLPTLTGATAAVHDRTVTLVDADGPRGRRHEFAVHTKRRDGTVTGAFHFGGAGSLPAAAVPTCVQQAAVRAWRARFAG